MYKLYTANEAEAQSQPKASKKQTDPPSIPVCELFTEGSFPIGQIMEHGKPRDLDK